MSRKQPDAIRYILMPTGMPRAGRERARHQHVAPRERKLDYKEKNEVLLLGLRKLSQDDEPWRGGVAAIC